MNTQSTIERFILDDLLSGARESLDPNEPLITSGTLDSVGVLRIITFLEEQFGLTIGDGEVGNENFGTLEMLTAFVDRKQAENRSASS